MELNRNQEVWYHHHWLKKWVKGMDKVCQDNRFTRSVSSLYFESFCSLSHFFEHPQKMQHSVSPWGMSVLSENAQKLKKEGEKGKSMRRGKQ